MNMKSANFLGKPGGCYARVLTSSIGIFSQLTLKCAQIIYSGVFEVAEHECEVEKCLRCTWGEGGGSKRFGLVNDLGAFQR